jgi:hypothetical protein
MPTSLATRASRASFAAMLVLSLSLSPSFARTGGSAGGSFARPAFGTAHFSHFVTHGFSPRFDAGRFSLNRFGPNRFDRFGFNRFNRFGFNRYVGNQLFVGGWGGWGGYSVPAAASEPIIVGDGAPVIINIGADPGPSEAGAGYGGGCVIHKLNYDANGKYVGERQIPLC